METTSNLTAQAARLSEELTMLSERCGHDSIIKDITNISGELTMLSETLQVLHEAICANESAYTTAFRQDLEEIANELHMVFDEIQECSSQLQKADSPSYSAVSWFFRKGRASRLQKHLEALMSTIVVMRTVLHHGKDYGIQTSPGRLAESVPHTMSEDRAILESVFAKNRNAIVDLHNLKANRSHNHSSSTSSDVPPELSPGAHGRNLSFATGVDTISVQDVLPPRVGYKEEKRSANEGLARRFSKRVGLGIHKSLLEIKATEAETVLRKRWIRADIGKPMPSIAEASSATDGSTVTSTDAEAFRSVPEPATSRKRTNSLALKGSSIGKSLSRAIRGLSIGNKQVKDKNSKENSPVKDSDYMTQQQILDEGDQQDSVNALKLKLSKPDLMTPDYNKNFENGV